MIHLFINRSTLEFLLPVLIAKDSVMSMGM